MSARTWLALGAATAAAAGWWDTYRTLQQSIITSDEWQHEALGSERTVRALQEAYDRLSDRLERAESQRDLHMRSVGHMRATLQREYDEREALTTRLRDAVAAGRDMERQRDEAREDAERWRASSQRLMGTS